MVLQVVNNFDWYRDMTFLGFLRDVGKHARMGTMLNKDSVKTRLAGDAGMSFTEFTYQLLQVHFSCAYPPLARRYCTYPSSTAT
jgi:tyrosyl-tRNA synthetase